MNLREGTPETRTLGVVSHQHTPSRRQDKQQQQQAEFKSIQMKSVIIYKNKSILVEENNVKKIEQDKVRPDNRKVYLQTKLHNQRRQPGNLAMDSRKEPVYLSWGCLLAIGHLLLLGIQLAQAVAPTIDYSHNMRILKLPKSTRVGEIIYRLRGSDGDPGGQLRFGVARGLEGRALVDIMTVPGSWNEADVYLRMRLDRATPTSASSDDPIDPYRIGSQSSPTATTLSDEDDNFRYLQAYNLTIYVADASNHTTQVDSTILVTNDESDGGEEADGTGGAATPTSGSNDEGGDEQRKYYANAGNRTRLGVAVGALAKQTARNPPQMSPFLRPRHVFAVPENAQPGESLGFLTVRESDKSDLPVRFELRGSGADHFAIKYVFGPRVGQSRAELLLRQPVDFEHQNLFQLKVLALNAWTNVRYDTRNVATLDIVVAVGDVQDTAPQFREMPRTLRVANTVRAGDLLARVRAEDGDYADQRPVQYALDASSPLAQHFEIDKKTGDITLAKSVYELAATLHTSELAASDSPALLVLASELPDSSSYDHLWPPMIARAELPLELVDATNEPPRFIGGTLDAGSATPTLRGYIREFSNTRTASSSGGGSRQQHDDSLDDQQSSGHSSTTGGQLVQWYTNLTAAAPTDLTGEANPSTGQQPNWASIAQQLLKTTRGRPLVIDLGQGQNGTFELSLEGPDGHLFELTPSHAVSRLAVFQLQVAASANKSLFDFDQTHSEGRFNLELVARDFGSPQRAIARLRCQIDLVDVNDNGPQFDSDLYTFSVFENAQVGQILGSIRARDMDRVAGLGGGLLAPGAYQRVRYTSLTGRDNHLFRLDPESGLITLEGQLDREKQDHYLLLAEARDASGQAANYTKIVVNVLDVNDNAPVFTQAHYDAVLQADGTFNQPLVVSATDNDEPNSANSQVAYEIIAGNQNDLFAIDSLSGAIYPTGGELPPLPTRPIQLPSILSEPILPYINTLRDQHHHQGKILPSPNSGGGGGGSGGSSPTSHEIEETTQPNGARQPLRLNWPRSAGAQQGESGLRQVERLDANLNKLLVDHPALDMILNVDHVASSESAHHHQVRAIASPTTPTPTTGPPPQTAQSHRGGSYQGHLPIGGASGQPFDASRVPPLTSLVVRAHDFGIPLRSATSKVNIYNQALLQRQISVILNGTAEQLEQRREMLERAFGALTGSRAQIEAIDALSDSSSISVARMRLAVPAGHSLIDLTDLSSLMSALDYKPPAHVAHGTGGSSGHLDQFQNGPVHYITAGDRVYPVHASTNTTSGTGLYTDLTPLEAHNSSMLERKLLFYIIIVGICILALLVIWMIYFCCREDQQAAAAARQVKVLEAGQQQHQHHHHHRKSHRHRSSTEESSIDFDPTKKLKAHAKQFRNQNSNSRTHLMDEQQSSELMMGRSASQLNLNGHGQTNQLHLADKTTQAKTTAHAQHPIGKNLGKQLVAQGSPHQLSIPGSQQLKPDHLSMYNGQVWFEQGGLVGKNRRGRIVQHPGGGGGGQHLLGPGWGRRASSAPSAGGLSLDSGLHAIVARGRNSALSPATSGFLTPGGQGAGQFFPNTLGYAENLATIATPSGSAYILPAGTGTHPKRGLAGRGRRRVAPMVVGAGGGGGHANEAFERDLESGAESVGGGRDRVHRRRPGTGKSSTGSHSSSSGSDGQTRTLDESDEHESVLLDSDQELLGFDSTGTPIIATHTRNRAARTGPEVPMTDLAPPAIATTTTGSSPATTTATTGTTVIQAEVKPLAPLPPSGCKVAETTTVQESKTEVAKTNRPKEKESGDHGQETLGERPIEGAAGTQQKTKASMGDTKRPSGDLMSELNERLNSANRQRTLRSQSAGDDESRQQPLRPQVVQEKRQSESTLPPLILGHNTARDHMQSPAEATGGADGKKVKLESQQSTTSSKLSQSQRRRVSATESLSCQSTMSSEGAPQTGDDVHLRDMKNGELLEKQSIFAITYSGLATDQLPS